MATIVNDRIQVTVFTGRIEVFIGRGDVHVFEIRQGDENRPIKFTFKDQDGNALDFSGTGAGKFTMTLWKNGTRYVDLQAMASGDNSGNIQYNWGSGELDQPGLYIAEIQLTENGGSAYYVPEKIEIRVLPKLSSS